MRQTSFARVVVMFAGCGAAHFAQSQSTIRVPADQSTVQAAIDAAANGSTISIAPGTYHERIDFRGKAITVEGAGPREAVVLDGGLQGPVVSFQNSEGRGSVLQHLTVQHGAPAPLTAQGQLTAGGIFIRSASPSIVDVVIQENASCGVGAYASALLLQGSLVERTSASAENNGCPLPPAEQQLLPSAQGTGIFLVAPPQSGLQAILQGNTVQSNSSNAYSTAGIQAVDAGLVLILGNLITGNTSEAIGAGIGVSGATSATIVQNVVSGNTENSPAILNSARAATGGINIDTSAASRTFLTNNTISSNKSAGKFYLGTQVYLEPLSTAYLSNNLIVAGDGLVALECDLPAPGQTPGTLSLSHNDAYSFGTAYGDHCSADLGSNGNLAADPLFSSPGTFTLQTNSPAVDAGDNGAVGLGNTDFAGAPRIQNAKGLPTAIIDIGAYEHAGVPAPVIAADFSLAAGASSANLSSGSAPPITLALTPNSSFASTVELACSGLPARVQCTFQPASVNLRSSAPQTVQLILSRSTARAALLRSIESVHAVWLAALLFPCFPGIRRRHPKAAVLGVLLLLTGCVHVTLGTDFPVTVNATAQTGQQHSVAINVIAPNQKQ